MVRSHLEDGVSSWAVHFKSDVDKLEYAQVGQQDDEWPRNYPLRNSGETEVVSPGN